MTTRKFSRPTGKDKSKKAKATTKSKKKVDIDKLTPKEVAQLNPRMFVEHPGGGPDPAGLLSPRKAVNVVSPRVFLDHGPGGPDPAGLLSPKTVVSTKRISPKKMI